MRKNLIRFLILVIAIVTVISVTSCDMLADFGINIPGIGDNTGNNGNGNSGNNDSNGNNDNNGNNNNSGGDDGSNDESLPEKEGELLLIHNGKALFNVIYTSSAGASGKRAADTFIKDLRNFGVEINDAISDRDASRVTDREIIIGANATNRGDDCCVTRNYMGADGQVIKIVGKRIIIAGGTPELTAKTFDVYVRNQMKINSKTEEITTLSVVDDYSYIRLTEYGIDSIKIGDTDLEDFTLVYDISALATGNFPSNTIKTFATSIFEKSGILVESGPLSKVDSYAHALIIRYVDTYVGNYRDRTHELEVNGGFRAYIDGDDYIIECSYKNAFEDSYTNFMYDVFLSKRGDIVVTEDYTDDAGTVYYEEFGAKGNGSTDDFEAMYKAHVYANQCGQTVCGKPGAHYYIGPGSLNKNIPVMTNVNFNGATITVNDVGSAAYTHKDKKLFATIRQYKDVYVSGDEVKALYEEYKAANPDAPENLVIGIDTESFPWLAPKLDALSMVRIISKNHKDFVRHGSNQSDGNNRTDIFMVEANGDFVRETDKDLDGNGVIGNVTTPVAYSFGSTDISDPSVTRETIDTTITDIYIYRADDEPITIENGEFYNICCQAVAETDFKCLYRAHYRGFGLYRNNVTIKDIKHRMIDEPEMGLGHEGHQGWDKQGDNCDDKCQKFGSRKESYPYYGFFYIECTYNLNIMDCSITGHTTYYEDKPATGSTGGKIPDPVAMGSYDYVVEYSSNVTFYNVTQGFSQDPDNPSEELDTGIGDSRYWGVMSSNGSKNMRFEECRVNRFDAHRGFWNAQLINTEIGHSFNVVGGGTLNAIGVIKRHGSAFISLRGDYGGTFRGDMNLIDCTFLNYASYNTNRDGHENSTVNTNGTIINSGFSSNNSGYRDPAACQAAYDEQYAKTYAEEMLKYEESIAAGTMTLEQAETKADEAAVKAAKNMGVQGSYWLWDFGYDCYLPINVTIKNFVSTGTKTLALFPKLPNTVFRYNYDPDNITKESITNVFNITQQINIVEESAADMPTPIVLCASTNSQYSDILNIPITYGYEWNNPFEN